MTTTNYGVSGVGYDISALSSLIVEVWFRDEAGLGRQGTIRLLWTKQESATERLGRQNMRGFWAVEKVHE